MGEVYPSDNTLLNLQADAESGVEYIPTGAAPYYLHFRKLLYRLLLATHRANDLRVFDEGGLEVGVKAGRFWLGTMLLGYAGSTGNALADDKAAIYLYLTVDGTLVANEYAGFPDMATTPHVRLAIITTSAGDITSIVDCRGGHNCIVPHGAGGVRTAIEAHTNDDALAAVESGGVHTNLGATAVVTLSLPADPPQGTQFSFGVQAAQELRIDPGSATIRDDSGQTPGKYKSAGAVGAALTLVADANGDWATIAKNGTWSEQA